jgi:hypothetical protein
MASKEYRYKQLSGFDSKGKRIRSWHRPIILLRKVGDSSCIGCYFDAHHTCDYQLKSKQLPSCVSSNAKRQYIFVKLLNFKPKSK